MKRLIVLFIWFLVLAGVACAVKSVAPSPSPTIQIVRVLPTSTTTTAPTKTPTPTASLTPTLTPLPSSTPFPSSTPPPTATPGRGPELLEIGQSGRSVTINAVRIGNGPQAVLFVGGLHAGFAPNTVSLASQAADYFSEAPNLVPETITLYIVVSLNPDSAYAPGEIAGRLNARGVDLNRNWDCNWRQDALIEDRVVFNSGGAEPFSEPETQALRNLILNRNIRAVIFWEARAANGLVSPGGCGAFTTVSGSLAMTYGEAAGYRVVNFEELTEQSLTGDASNWLDSQGIPAIFVLLPYLTSFDWENNLAGMLAVMESTGQ